jgi:hypothetical protein
MVAEVPEELTPARELFRACGYVQEALLTDFVMERPALSERGDAARVEGFVIPVTIDDLAANGLVGEGQPQTCWERSIETLTARKDEIQGLAVATDERIEAYLLYVTRELDPPTFAPSGQRELRRDLAGALAEAGAEIVSLRSFIDDSGARLKGLLSQLRARGVETVRLPKVHPAEISKEWLEMLRFSPDGAHLLYTARARSA